ncbi:hypothetical protein [Mucilaginibacter sp.]|uniref:hypothetical protein n=1 Tax=Mucilaginibacter sp. TaxID=1882438 RepID=UPI000CBF2F38|nr:hypothetical protein [Mucilaginibacter sp.]PLW88516.1 MAG: hypothetical protein C0154_16460 [Mucilaginibacter sp.]HEK22201.1 hypothetical protein [Bacteroidota bacterium]
METHTFRWFLPTSMRSKTNYYEFDITKHCKIFLNQTEYYNRTMKFDSQYDLDQDFTGQIEQILIKINPFTSEPMSNTHKANTIVAKEIGTFPDFEHIFHRGNLRLARGLVIIEITFSGEYTYTENLKADEETDIEKMMNWNMDFEDMRRKMISLASDICSFFLLGLHITYPTHSNSHESFKPQSSGLLAFTGNGQYIMDEHSDIFSYPLLLEEDRVQALEAVLPQIAQVWHKNIWSFYRFLKGVRSDYITIDNFLDLVFTLESFYDNNTSTEIMKLVSSVIIAENKADAKKIQQLLNYCFRIRNEVAHGGTNYRLYDYVPKKPNEPQDKLLIVKLYWGLKNLNIQLLYYGIQKMLNDKNPKPASSIRFGISDISDKCVI